MAKIDQRLVDLLKSYGEDNTSVWDCHGTWVAYHAAIERMAARAGIIFDGPQMIVNDPDKKTVVISVSARMGDKHEWSFGEVSPANNKNSYPYAMAEKRAKDRVALKLLGMAGLAYSEEEADDFKVSKPAQQEAETKPKLSPMPAIYDALFKSMKENKTVRDLAAWWKDEDCVTKRKTMPQEWQQVLYDEFSALGFKFKAAETDSTVNAIQQQFPGSTVVSDAEASRHPLNA